MRRALSGCRVIEKPRQRCQDDSMRTFLALVALLAFLRAAYADSFTVNSTTDAVDVNPGDGTCATAGSVCTLRAAIQEANAHAGDDTIDVPAGTYVLTIPPGAETTAA